MEHTARHEPWPIAVGARRRGRRILGDPPLQALPAKVVKALEHNLTVRTPLGGLEPLLARGAACRFGQHYQLLQYIMLLQLLCLDSALEDALFSNTDGSSVNFPACLLQLWKEERRSLSFFEILGHDRMSVNSESSIFVS